MTPFDDTIVGPATAPGEAGVGIVRLSGPLSLSILQSFFSAKNPSSLRPWRLAYGFVLDQGQPLDEVLAVYMKPPKSYTAELVVEIFCHGGGLILRRVIELCLAQGARLAGPGEFTQRAFVNGRIDLTQAEAVGDLVRVKTDLGLHLVINQLKGKLYQRILALKEQLSWVLALLGASIDFPEEDVVFAHQEEITAKLTAARADLWALVQSAKGGRTVTEGYKLVLAGRPNVGKSSLLNGLLEEDRAIVTAIPGTTRDTLEESFSVGGVPVKLVDTAGLRDTEDLIEQMGISRSVGQLAQADLMLWVLDASAPDYHLPPEVLELRLPKLLVYNKADLVTQPPLPPAEWAQAQTISLSALSRSDLERLKAKLFALITTQVGPLSESGALTNLRQEEAAKRALSALDQGLQALKEGAGEELLSLELSLVLGALGEIVGETTPEEMLNRIFGSFCIGK